MKLLTKILPLALLTVGLTSCLDDEPIVGDTRDAKNIIEFYETPDFASTPELLYPQFIKTFEIVPSTTYDVTVAYAGTDVAPKDIEVGITVDEAALDAFNAKIVADARAAAIEAGEDPDEAEEHVQGDLYDMMPSNLYSVPSSVTIKQGERLATFQVTVNPELFDFSYKYGLPLSLSAEGMTISGNFGTAIFSLGAKNRYDGNYTVTALTPMVDAQNATLSGYYPLDADLVTVSANEVKMFTWTYLGGLEGHPIKSGTSSSYYGSFGPVFKMDAEGNVIEVYNYYGQPAANGRSARLDPSGVNKFTFDAEGKVESLDVKYIMVQNGDRTFFHEKWTYEGPRD